MIRLILFDYGTMDNSSWFGIGGVEGENFDHWLFYVDDVGHFDIFWLSAFLGHVQF